MPVSMLDDMPVDLKRDAASAGAVAGEIYKCSDYDTYGSFSGRVEACPSGPGTVYMCLVGDNLYECSANSVQISNCPEQCITN